MERISHHLDALARGPSVVLLEGRRSLSADMAPVLRSTGEWLARTCPNVIFRSGNADGSDTAFATGVVAVDSGRMQYVLPSPGMGKPRRHPDAPCFALTDLPQPELDALCDLTVAVSPGIRRLAYAACGRIKSGPLAGKGRYLLRDTLKVAGSPALGLEPASLALFYVDLADPESGGTGHSVRVCRHQGVPALFQDQWMTWLQQGSP
jgi:hypothetical protein